MKIGRQIIQEQEHIDIAAEKYSIQADNPSLMCMSASISVQNMEHTLLVIMLSNNNKALTVPQDLKYK